MKWQIFIFTFSISLCFIAANPNPIEDSIARIKRSADHIHDVVFSHRLRLPQLSGQHQIRHKRTIDWTNTDEIDDSSMCLLTCAYQLQQAAARYKNRDDDDHNLGSNAGANRLLKPTLNLTRLNNVCASMRPSVQYFDRCPTSDLKIQLKSSLEPIRFLCLDRFNDFMNNLRCMHKLDTTATSQCQPRCRRFEAAVNKTVQLGERPYLRRLYSIDELKDMISGTCQFVQCYMDCSLPLMRSVCGETAAELSKGLIQKMFASIQNYDKISNGAAVLPASCRRLAQPDDDEAVDNDDDDVDEEVPILTNRDNRNPWMRSDQNEEIPRSAYSRLYGRRSEYAMEADSTED